MAALAAISKASRGLATLDLRWRPAIRGSKSLKHYQWVRHSHPRVRSEIALSRGERLPGSSSTTPYDGAQWSAASRPSPSTVVDRLVGAPCVADRRQHRSDGLAGYKARRNHVTSTPLPTRLGGPATATGSRDGWPAARAPRSKYCELVPNEGALKPGIG